jgi:hypothetical protein
VRGTRGTYGGGERCLEGFASEARRYKRLLEGLGVGGRIILTWTLGK